MNRGLMRQAQQLQAKLEKAQEELERTTVEASSGGGAITVVITGGMKVESVKISPEVVDAAEVEMLGDLVLTAVNEAIRKSQEMASSQLGKITGGLKIPGL